MDMVKSIQLAIIQPFTLIDKFEQIAAILNFVKKWNLMIIFKMNVKYYTENQNDRHLLNFYLSESCKRLNNSQLHRFYL